MGKSNSKANRKQFGLNGGPLTGTRVLAKPMAHDFNGKQGVSLLVIDDKAKTVVSGNVYGSEDEWHFGKGYSTEGLVHPLPAEGSEKWKKWHKRGYRPTTQNFGGCVAVTKAKAKATAPKA